jgi:hypothetical protein
VLACVRALIGAGMVWGGGDAWGTGGRRFNGVRQRRRLAIHGFAYANEISRFFLNLLLMDGSEMNDIIGFIFVSACLRFCSRLCVFNIPF